MKTIKIKQLGIEVEEELRIEVLKKYLVIPKGWRLLTFSEYSYIAENELLPVTSEKRQWGTIKGKIVSLLSCRSIVGDWLDVDSYDWSDGYAFGVRFCREIK